MKSFLLIFIPIVFNLDQDRFHFLKKTILLEHHQVHNSSIVEYQDLRYEIGEKYPYYISENINSSNYGFNFTIEKCGKIILDVPMIENVNYSIQFQLQQLQENQTMCIGISSQGFLTSEILQIEYQDIKCQSFFQLGYCSDGTNSSKYFDMYTDYNEFENINYDEQYIDEIVYSYGVPEFENSFSNNDISMNLEGQSLIITDREAKKVLWSTHLLDRKRIYFPVIIFKEKEVLSEEIQKKLKNKKSKKSKVNLEDYKCVKPINLSNETLQKQIQADNSLTVTEKEVDEEEQNNVQFLQFNPFAGRIEDQAPSPKKQKKEKIKEEVVVEDNGMNINWTYIQFNEVQSHGLEQEDAYQPMTKEIQILRTSMNKQSENLYTIYQQNSQLPFLLQNYESCSYAYLDVIPFDLSSNAYLEISIIQLDFTHGVYPIGVGVFAANMIDRLKGWRNAQSQIWCTEKISSYLWQYGSIYRSDGTFVDSVQLGEYNIYKSEKTVNRQSKIKMYFTKGNRVVYQLGEDKELIVTCVNPRFKYFLPIFELKAWRGKPMIRLDRYRSHETIPFEFSDSEANIQQKFHGKQFMLLSKFFTEKRGAFNEMDDDYSLSSHLESEGNTASINMWETSLFGEQYEWFVRIDYVDNSPGSQTQICIGVHQISQESMIDSVLKKNFKAQVACNVCDKRDFVHTFFEECPIYENPIAFVNGTILRFRLSNYLMEVTDGYNELYFSLRSEGLTGVVPSAVVWNSPGNMITFLKGGQKIGPNPMEILAKNKEQILNFQNFVNYDVFSLPLFNNQKSKILMIYKEGQFEIKYSDGDRKNCEEVIGKEEIGKEELVEIKEGEEKKEEELKKTEQDDNQDDFEVPDQSVIAHNAKTIPQEKFLSQMKRANTESCLQIFEQCNYQGKFSLICNENYKEAAMIRSFKSVKLMSDKYEAIITLRKNLNLIENLIVSKNIECLINPIFLSEIDLNIKIK